MNKSHFYIWIFFLPFVSVLLILDSFLIVSGLQFAHVWKVCFILLGFFIVIVQQKLLFWQFCIFVLAFKMVALTANLQFFTMEQIVEAARFLMLPLFYSVLLFLDYTDSKKLILLANLLSKLAIILCLPFAFELIDSPYERENEFGVESLIGVFHTNHSASLSLSACALILFSSFRSSSNLVDFIFAFLGIYLVYLTFVRTGLALLVLGIIYIYLPRKLNIRNIFEASVVLISIGLIALFLIQDEVYYARLFDISPSGVQREFGSGRIVFHIASFQHLSEMSLLEILFGVGRSTQIELMYLSIGKEITSHNGFLDMLIQNGLIGLVFFIAFFKALWNVIQPSVNDRLIKGLFYMLLGFQILQGGFMFYFDFLFAILLLAHQSSQNSVPVRPFKLAK